MLISFSIEYINTINKNTVRKITIKILSITCSKKNWVLISNLVFLDLILESDFVLSLFL